MLADAATFDPDLPMRWTPAAQERLLEIMSTGIDPRVWYCTAPGRTCDGRPHEGYEYPHARADQWPPPLHEDWMFWVLLSGRGAGKTRAGAEWLRNMTRYTGRLSMIAPTAADLRDVMIEGDSGILRVCEQSAGYVPIWEPSKKRLTFPNGAICIGYTAEEPDRLRGRNDGAGWLDEPGHYDNVDYVWSMFMYGLRGGAHPRVAITTTPTPTPWLRELLLDPHARVTRVSTFANEANLPDAFIEQMRLKFAGTRMGRQELYGEVLEDVEGALWSNELLAATRVTTLPPMARIVVGVDPAGTSIKRSDETGIVVAGKGYNGDLYVLADYSGRYTPLEWAQAARDAYVDWQADLIVAETNYGGEMVEQNLRLNVGAFARTKMVNSRRGKFIRAEPVFGLFEQNKAHLAGQWNTLEDQLTSWVPGTGRSPDRLDAMVHAAHELIDLDTTVAIANPRRRGPSVRAVIKRGGANYTALKRMAQGVLR